MQGLALFVTYCRDGPTQVCFLANTKELGQVSRSVLILNGFHGEPGIGEGKECGGQLHPAFFLEAARC